MYINFGVHTTLSEKRTLIHLMYSQTLNNIS